MVHWEPPHPRFGRGPAKGAQQCTLKATSELHWVSPAQTLTTQTNTWERGGICAIVGGKDSVVSSKRLRVTRRDDVEAAKVSDRSAVQLSCLHTERVPDHDDAEREVGIYWSSLPPTNAVN